jgi:ADP-ribose pyrophosphatase
MDAMVGGEALERPGVDVIRELLEDDDRFAERIESSQTRWSGRIFSAHTYDVRLPDGTLGYREIVRHHGGAGVCAVREGRVCLVRQYRVALGRMTLEIPAGKLEEGEDPCACAARELLEETGLVASRLELVARSAGSPGFNDEKTRIFLAHGLEAHPAHPDEGEFVDVAWIPVDDVVRAVHEGLIQDSKTIVAVLVAKERGLG